MIVLNSNQYKELNIYLESRGISIVSSFEQKIVNAPLCKQEIDHQLHTINELHEKVIGMTGYSGGRIQNNTGKKVEQYKIYIKKLKREIKRINSDGVSCEFERVLMEKAPENLERAEICVKEIYDNGYYKLIERSMKRNEVCLGNTYVDNLVKDRSIMIKSLKKFCYNMVEFDVIYFLSKIKKRNGSIFMKDAIEEFCRLEGLDKNSERFILAALSYPIEFMKICDGHRYGKKNWSDEEYSKRLMSALGKDGEFLL